MTWPVTHSESSEASQAIRRAASSGVPQRPRGMAASARAFTSSGAQPVSVGPGLTALTVIPRGASASASDRTIPLSAALLAA